MTTEQTPDRVREASGSYGDVFRAAAEADTSGPQQAAPDKSEAAMMRLRAPFDAGPADGAENRT